MWVGCTHGLQFAVTRRLWTSSWVQGNRPEEVVGAEADRDRKDEMRKRMVLRFCGNWGDMFEHGVRGERGETYEAKGV